MTVAELARELVAIPSHEDERAAGDRIEAWLREHAAATVTRDEVGNVIARRDHGADVSLALVGHHDVVAPDDSQVVGKSSDDGEAVDGGETDDEAAPAEYVAEVRDGRLYGRGSADMKGSVAAAMVAFAEADPACELVFASFVGEETGGRGCRTAIEAGFAPDFAVVGEGSTGYSAPGVTDVAVAHKGRRAATVTARGAAAHASEPDAGVNAIYRATDAVDVLRDLEPASAAVLGHDVEGSVVVTEIEGGSGWNVVPERCSVTVDERTVPGERADLATVETVAGVSLTVDQDLPPMACDDDAFAAAVREAAAAVQDGDPAQVVKPHATDAGWLADRAGTTCVVCGPAEPGEAHTADESVSLDVLERCSALYRRVAERGF